MKQKLRKLVHKDKEYLYQVDTAYNRKGVITRYFRYVFS